MGRWDNEDKKKPSDFIRWDIIGDEGLDDTDKDMFKCCKELLKGIVDGEGADESWQRLEPIYGPKMLYMALEIVGKIIEKMATKRGIDVTKLKEEHYSSKRGKDWLKSDDFRADIQDMYDSKEKEKWK